MTMDDPVGARELGGLAAVGVLFMRSLSGAGCGDLLSDPVVPVGVSGCRAWGEKGARPQSTWSTSLNPTLREKGESEVHVSPFLFSCVLPFKCKEDAAQREHLCSPEFCG